MNEQEILIRAREALIVASPQALGQTLADIRAGGWDDETPIQTCITFANSLSLPLPAIQPPPPQLLAARQFAAAQLRGLGSIGAAEEVAGGKMDWQPLVVAFLAGAGA